MITVDEAELKRELAKIPEKIDYFVREMHGKNGTPKNPIRTAARNMAKVVEDEARNIAPVGERETVNKYGRFQPGRLRGAITKKIISTRFRDQATRQGNSREYYYVSAKLGAGRSDPRGAWYATPVEQGWEKGGRTRGGRQQAGRFRPGHHFLYEATQRKQKQSVQKFLSEMARLIPEAAHRTRLS